MYLTNVQLPPKSSARIALRRASEASHRRMHGLEPFAQIAAGTLQIDRYRLLLQALFRFHSAVGMAANEGGMSRLSSARRRLRLLRSDICFVGGVVPRVHREWQAGTGVAVLGALYTAEGSMLGGRVIAHQLNYAFGARPEGRRFFIGSQHDRATWSKLTITLEEQCADTCALDAAIVGACRAFDWFEQCIMSHVPS